MSSLHSAIAEGDLERVRALLAEGADPDEDSEEGPPLALAVQTERRELVELLLHHTKDPDVLSGDHDATALMWAARDGDLELIELALERGASVSFPNTHGQTALDWANGSYPALRRLLEIAMPSEGQLEMLLRETLEAHSIAGDLEHINAMLTEHAKWSRDALRKPWRYAGEAGRVDILEMLFSHEVLYAPALGEAALRAASSKERKDAVAFLLGKGVDESAVVPAGAPATSWVTIDKTKSQGTPSAAKKGCLTLVLLLARTHPM